MAFPFKKKKKKEVKQQSIEMGAPGERKKKNDNAIYDLRESFQSCMGYWNSNERISCFFCMPHFWDPGFDSYLKC